MLTGIIFEVKTQLLEFFYLEDTFIQLEIFIDRSLFSHCGYLLLIRCSDWHISIKKWKNKFFSKGTLLRRQNLSNLVSGRKINKVVKKMRTAKLVRHFISLCVTSSHCLWHGEASWLVRGLLKSEPELLTPRLRLWVFSFHSSSSFFFKFLAYYYNRRFVWFWGGN